MRHDAATGKPGNTMESRDEIQPIDAQAVSTPRRPLLDLGAAMSAPKWTPGPWEVSNILATDDMICRGEGDSWIHHSRRVAGSGFMVAQVCADEPVNGAYLEYPSPRSSAEMLANGHLIAAAPELYEALELMLTEFNEQMAGIVHDELAVIAKARAALAKARGEKA